MCLYLAMVSMAGAAALALAGDPTEHQIVPKPNVLDTDDISSPTSKVWVMNFVFKEPAVRQITVDVPGRGRKVCWYLWYQVINNTKEPHTLIPKFELVRHDKKDVVYKDQVLPSVQKAIQLVEDPTDYWKVKNSVTISENPIPPSKKNAEKRVTGVAIWDDVDQDTTNFSILVSGLSNGYSQTDPIPPSKEPVTRRKTLVLKFKRTGDPFLAKPNDFHFQSPAEWKYIASNLPPLPGAKDANIDKKENAEARRAPINKNNIKPLRSTQPAQLDLEPPPPIK